MNKILEDDIQIISKYVPENLFGHKILITGATGLLGSLIIKGICTANKNSNKPITVLANCRSLEKFNDYFKNFKSDFLLPVIGDIQTTDFSKLDFDYIVHGASITDSKTFITKPVETIETAIIGTNNILKACIGKPIKSFVYLSSLEVYGAFNDYDGIKNILENDYGFIDHLNIRSSYSESKKTVECLCRSYNSEYRIPVVIARLSQTFGAGIQYNDNRVFAQFARAIIENKDIVLKTKGETIRNYCYTTDAINGIFYLLTKGSAGEAYNIANKSTTISIADMAKKYCELYSNSKSSLVFDIAEDATKLGYNPTVKIKLDSSKLESLGWTANINFDLMIKRLIEGMKQ